MTKKIVSNYITVFDSHPPINPVGASEFEGFRIVVQLTQAFEEDEESKKRMPELDWYNFHIYQDGSQIPITKSTFGKRFPTELEALEAATQLITSNLNRLVEQSMGLIKTISDRIDSENL